MNELYNGLVPAGKFLCPNCCEKKEDDSFFSKEEIIYTHPSIDDIEANWKEYYDRIPEYFPSESEMNELGLDILFQREAKKVRRLIIKSSAWPGTSLDNRTIVYDVPKCPACDATLNIPLLGDIPAMYIGNIGSTSCGKTTLYESIKTCSVNGNYAGVKIQVVVWKHSGRDVEMEKTKQDMPKRTSGNPEYRFIFIVTYKGRQIMIVYRDFAGENLRKNTHLWTKWFKHMNVLIISIDPEQLKGAHKILLALQGQQDEEYIAVFGSDRVAVQEEIDVLNKDLIDFLVSLSSNESIDWKKTRLQFMLTKSNKLALFCREAQKGTGGVDWNAGKEDGISWPVLSDLSIVFQDDTTKQNQLYYPDETLAVSRILWYALRTIDAPLYAQYLRPLLDNAKTENGWERQRAIAFCSNAICFNKNGEPDYEHPTRVMDQMLWSLHEIAGFEWN